MRATLNRDPDRLAASKNVRRLAHLSNEQATFTARERSDQQRWTDWQREIVGLLEKDLGEAIGRVGLDDVDWFAWRPLFEEGRSARSAIDRALERDL